MNETTISKSSRNRLTHHLLPQFAGDTLFDAIARAVCGAGCLPRKELYEAWEVARRVRRRFRGGRIVDLACGHGLLAMILLIMDDSSPEAVAVDRRIPKSSTALKRAMFEAWPRLEGRVRFVEAEVSAFELKAGDVVVSAHACGALSDLVIDRAMGVGARVGVLPCCHDYRGADLGGLEGWLDGALALDVMRASRLRAAGYRVYTQEIPGDITPKNRLLLGVPDKPQER